MRNVIKRFLGVVFIVISFLSVLVFTIESPVFAKYPKYTFAVSRLHIDSVREPHGWEYYLKSREGQVITSAVASYMGINPAYVYLAINTLPTATVKGEETFYDLLVPDGYVYCGSRVRVISIVPNSGSRASTINVTVFPNPDKLGIYTRTPVLGLGQGRSWVEADVEVYGILPEYYEEFKKKGICASSSPATILLNCSGNPCDGFAHGRLEDMGSIVPDLTKGW